MQGRLSRQSPPGTCDVQSNVPFQHQWPRMCREASAPHPDSRHPAQGTRLTLWNAVAKPGAGKKEIKITPEHQQQPLHRAQQGREVCPSICQLGPTCPTAHGGLVSHQPCGQGNVHDSWGCAFSQGFSNPLARGCLSSQREQHRDYRADFDLLRF